jgi:peptidoglycan hydrolase-like protein with peptidoglycan-binding domain
MQIQQALADRGYYKGSVDGSWNGDSVDALKRYQKDQKLTSDGKISSLALIGLGLGPKHEPIGDYAAKPVAEPPSNP